MALRRTRSADRCSPKSAPAGFARNVSSRGPSSCVSAIRRNSASSARRRALRVHETRHCRSTIPVGDRLREWMGVDRETFYDEIAIAIVGMAFCFPGYDANGADQPPPQECADSLADKLFATLPRVQITLLVGSYAQTLALGRCREIQYDGDGQGVARLCAALYSSAASVVAQQWLAEEESMVPENLLPALATACAALLSCSAPARRCSRRAASQTTRPPSRRTLSSRATA